MAQGLRGYIAERLHLGEMTVHHELAVIPLLASTDDGPDYITLGEAFAAGGFAVVEVNESGSVPNLKVVNGTARNVLILDGEELAGAKQNRVLNTTILVPAGESRIIPVSCTEQGRWHYASAGFSESGHMMSCSIRSRKNLAVEASVRRHRSFVSDQREVWNDITALHRSHGTLSETGAMKDAFDARRRSMEAYLTGCPLQERQCGSAVLIKGSVAGIEFVSRPEAYRRLHEKLLGSYVMDIPMARAGESGPSEGKVRRIMERIMESAEERFPSVGLGEDCRYTAAGLVGSALAIDRWYLHTAFFRSERSRRDSDHERMSSMNRRRGYRSRSGSEAGCDNPAVQ